MVCGNGRVIQPEWLDNLPHQESQPSLKDLIRINRFLGGHRAAQDAVARVAKRTDCFSLLDVGAASGDMAAAIHERFPLARITCLDYRVDHLERAQQSRVAADAFAPPFRPGSFDFVFCSLFLHHFTNDHVVQLLSTFRVLARQAVVVTDLERHILPYYFLPGTRWLFNWHRVTLHDGPISVEAAFLPAELSALAAAAGLKQIEVRTHRPAFRLSLTGRV